MAPRGAASSLNTPCVFNAFGYLRCRAAPHGTVPLTACVVMRYVMAPRGSGVNGPFVHTGCGALRPVSTIPFLLPYCRSQIPLLQRNIHKKKNPFRSSRYVENLNGMKFSYVFFVSTELESGRTAIRCHAVPHGAARHVAPFRHNMLQYAANISICFQDSKQEGQLSLRLSCTVFEILTLICQKFKTSRDLNHDHLRDSWSCNS